LAPNQVHALTVSYLLRLFTTVIEISYLLQLSTSAIDRQPDPGIILGQEGIGSDIIFGIIFIPSK
jgi:hypothetical protein